MEVRTQDLAFDPAMLEGLSEKLLRSHHQNNYGGAVRRLNAIRTQLGGMAFASAPGFQLNGLKREELIATNSMLLHELYSDGLTAKPGDPREDIRSALARRFGSLERWAEDFKACSMAAAGWGILARDIVNGQLYNVASDVHEVGVLWLGQPLVVCDVYEHAFYVDYLNRKQEYVNKFVEFLDWDEINRRWQALAV